VNEYMQPFRSHASRDSEVRSTPTGFSRCPGAAAGMTVRTRVPVRRHFEDEHPAGSRVIADRYGDGAGHGYGAGAITTCASPSRARRA